MDSAVRKTIVVSAVNIRKGGTLTILRQHLEELSAMSDRYRIIAIVHNRQLCDFPGIEYIELKWCIKSWVLRLWAEYVTMHRISRQIAAQDGQTVWKWLSLHDTTPRVEAIHREVYCQTSFPFLKLRLSDFLADPKIPLFTMFTRWAYKINSRKNDCMIVQQEWFRQALSELISFPVDRIVLRPPVVGKYEGPIQYAPQTVPTFFYPSTPDCHKNFETLCKAAVLLENGIGRNRFKVIITVKGNENRYARHLFSQFGKCGSIDFHGLMDKTELFSAYASASCLVFASRIETWGLPISEFLSVQPDGRMLLSDLPYAHETSGEKGSYFDPDSPQQLVSLMRNVIRNK